MQKVTLDEIIGLDRYEKIRDEFRRRIIDLKTHRRVSVGDRGTFVFENRETVLFQIQEMLRAEHITDIDKVRFEVAIYNDLIPGDSELSATMLIEITEQAQIRPALVQLIGVDQAVSLQIGGQFSIPGVFEGGRSTEDNLSAVQYVRFPLSTEACAAFRAGSGEIRLVITHPNYHAQTVLNPDTRRSLASDL
ncbi:MAG: DUF3501 family protein [Deltaproteobacteria bacterium]|nr:DUF3501 family protein [Deltaproteobacteria bacterium]